jgi:hypothetical protein
MSFLPSSPKKRSLSAEDFGFTGIFYPQKIVVV